MNFKDLKTSSVLNVAMAPDLNACGKFLGFTASDLDPIVFEATSSWDKYSCPRGTNVSLYQDKLISSTKITGATGSIKEMAGFDDWHISFDFVFVPVVSIKYLVMSELDDLLKLWRKKESLKITNSLFLNLGIKSIVLTKLDLPNNETDHELKVRLEALSDEIDVSIAKLTLGGIV